MLDGSVQRGAGASADAAPTRVEAQAAAGGAQATAEEAQAAAGGAQATADEAQATAKDVHGRPVRCKFCELLGFQC